MAILFSGAERFVQFLTEDIMGKMSLLFKFGPVVQMF